MELSCRVINDKHIKFIGEWPRGNSHLNQEDTEGNKALMHCKESGKHLMLLGNMEQINMIPQASGGSRIIFMIKALSHIVIF